MDEIAKKLRKMDRRRKAFKKLMKRKRIYQHIELTVKRRRKAEQRFKAYGIIAIAVSLLFVVILFSNIISKGYGAFLATEIKIPVIISSIDKANPNYQQILIAGVSAIAQGDSSGARDISPRNIVSLFSKDAIDQLKKIDSNDLQQEIWLKAASSVDMFYKNNMAKAGKLSGSQIQLIKELAAQNRVKISFSTSFFTEGDSREPEMAGILGGFVGSLMVVLSSMLIAFPIGVMTAIYLEEFAPKNKFTDFIEININNLAAIPSIVYGLLGLTIYIQLLGVPRSAPIVGGLTLAMIALPVIVIATRTSIKAIPKSIRDGALALGANHLQVVLHHILPLAMPGIMTGTILSIARIIGETAPLLMIGMVAFIVDIPTSFLSPSSVLPVQIYLWSDSAEQGFVERTYAAIIILLLLLALINLIAVYLRKKFSVRW